MSEGDGKGGTAPSDRSSPRRAGTARGTAKGPPGSGGAAKSNGWDNGRAAGEEVEFGHPGGPILSGYLARPNFSAATGAGRHGVVLSHGFPEPKRPAGAPGHGYRQLATRLAAETGATVLTFDFREAGGSDGDYPLFGWRSDLAAAIGTVRAVPGIERVWLVGFAAAATLSICAAAEDPAVAGVACFAAPAELAAATDPKRATAPARTGAGAGGQAHPYAAFWAGELAAASPARQVARIPPRPLLIVHGTNDDVVPLTDARELADAANASAELRVIMGAGHMLMHDPRAVALLLGWFDRHLGAAG